MNIENERKLFLEHMRSIGAADFMFELDEYGDFDDMSMGYSWLSWQASANREGFVLVPVKPSYDMIVSAADEHVKNGASYSGIYKAMIKASQFHF